MSVNKGRDTADFFLFEFLRNPLDDDHDMVVNGASVPVNFQYLVPSGKTAQISRLNFQIIDGGIGYNEFGGLGSVLTNGLLIKVLDTDGTTVLIDFMDGETIKSNEDFNALAGVDTVTTPAAGDDQLAIRWTIARANDGGSMTLHEGQILRVTVQDDISALTKFQIMVQGKVY